MTTDWQQILERHSFLEGDALERATALLDPGSARVLCGPFDRLESPWLEPQGIVPQADDGVVVALGTLGGQPAVIASIEQRFQGGGTGEVSGAKISQALRLAADDSRAGTPTAAVLLFETGGVRLQEANLGLNAVAEICSAVLDLRPLAPVVGLVAGEVGSFGGMSIAAGLCTRLVITPQGRIGLNGPAVIEQEAGIDEFDSGDRALIWSIDGGEQRAATGLADTLVADDRDLIRAAVLDAIAAGPLPAGNHRSERLDILGSRLARIDPRNPPAPQNLRQLWGSTLEVTESPEPAAPRTAAAATSRGGRWLAALAGTEPVAVIPSVVRADTPTATYLAVVPDPQNPFHRARNGEVGLTESLALAKAVESVIAADPQRAIVAVVDLPSQAYGRIEEMVGLHHAIATAVDAYHRARNAGHPIVAIVVGHALSGGFLAHGLQAQQILALDDPGVEIHAMHKSAAARITLRTIDELEKLAQTIVPLSYNVSDWAQLGLCDGLLTVSDADDPIAADIEAVRRAVDAAIDAARSGPRDLSNRLDSPGALTNRKASRAIRDAMSTQWHQGTRP
ncbi:biotin-independent malonate decarboxylase subunit beta [Mycobacterium sp. ACS1612]|uniref:biotin-independent malonate decarboxylase subunit beta n=1 Tax=Mycobacterium sp. ACS1612 TaxID=1834117 RepID=UPI0007FD8C58|nr:biotin-independent malonate decarboxylase subunit beta [Mycobacterium sp. ACS1612]OBF33603.1 biotin-independent malonate decarboxylase subunit beta [Mycobacterium sp. ACS1612]